MHDPSAIGGAASRERSPWRKWARWILPFVVSALLLWYVMSDLDVRAVLERMTPQIALHFAPPLAVFLVVTLLLEAMCLTLVVSHSQPFHDLWLAARIKAASYPLAILNYALGAAALSVLLRRRAGMRLSDAAGAVFVIGLFDLGSLLLIAIAGATLLGSEGAGMKIGAVLLATAAIAGGFVVLRAPLRLGPLDRLRELRVFRSARELPLELLFKLALLRFAFVASFILLSWSILDAFDVAVPLGHLIVNISILLLVAALPIAAAGLGTGQWLFVELFSRWADAETLMAASLTLSFALIATRSAIGLCFAREFAAEALAHSDEAGE